MVISAVFSYCYGPVLWAVVIESAIGVNKFSRPFSFPPLLGSFLIWYCLLHFHPNVDVHFSKLFNINLIKSRAYVPRFIGSLFFKISLNNVLLYCCLSFCIKLYVKSFKESSLYITLFGQNNKTNSKQQTIAAHLCLFFAMV